MAFLVKDTRRWHIYHIMMNDKEFRRFLISPSFALTAKFWDDIRLAKTNPSTAVQNVKAYSFCSALCLAFLAWRPETQQYGYGMVLFLVTIMAFMGWIYSSFTNMIITLAVLASHPEDYRQTSLRLFTINCLLFFVPITYATIKQ